jgi:hypothetical protein
MEGNAVMWRRRPSERTGDHHRRIVLARDLAAAGLWDGLPPASRAAAEREVAGGGYPFGSDYIQDSYIEFHADGEDLAEGEVEDFLKSLGHGLERYGLTLNVTSPSIGNDSFDVDNYVVNINGIRCVILRALKKHLIMPGTWQRSGR